MVASVDVTSGVLAACRWGRRRPNSPAGLAAHRAAATTSGRRRWSRAAQPLQGEEAVGDRDQGDVVVPAAEAAALEVVQPQGTLQLAVVLLNLPTTMHS